MNQFYLSGSFLSLKVESLRENQKRAMANRRYRSGSNNSDNDTVAYIVAEPLDNDTENDIAYPAQPPTFLDSPCMTPGRPVASAWPTSEPLPLEVEALPLEDIEDSGELSFGSRSCSSRSNMATGEAVIRRVNIGGVPVNVVGSSDMIHATQHRHNHHSGSSSSSHNRRAIVTAEPEIDTTIRRVNIGGGPVNIVGPSDLLRENEGSSITNPSMANRTERRRTYGNDGDYDHFRRAATAGPTRPTNNSNTNNVNRLERPSSHVPPSRYQVQSLNIGGERVNILTLTPDDEDEDDIYNFTADPRPMRSQAAASSVTVAAQRDAQRAGARNRSLAAMDATPPIDTTIRTVTIGGAPVNIVGGYNPAYNTMPTARPSDQNATRGGQGQHRESRGVSNTEPVIARAYTELYDSRPVHPVVRRVNIGGQPVNILQSSDQLDSRDRLPSFSTHDLDLLVGRNSDSSAASSGTNGQGTMLSPRSPRSIGPDGIADNNHHRNHQLFERRPANTNNNNAGNHTGNNPSSSRLR